VFHESMPLACVPFSGLDQGVHYATVSNKEDAVVTTILE
jgi:hypothetical protein